MRVSCRDYNSSSRTGTGTGVRIAVLESVLDEYKCVGKRPGTGHLEIGPNASRVAAVTQVN